MSCTETRFGPFSLGETHRKIELNGLIITDTEHRPNQILPRHRHQLANMLFVLRGSFSETINGRTQLCDRLSLFIRPAEEVHSNEYDSAGTRCLIVGLEQKWRDSVTPLSIALDRPRASRSATIAALGLRLHREFKLADEASALSIEGLVLELLAQVVRCSTPHSGSKPPAWLNQAEDFLHAHFSDSLALRETANRVGVHPVHLARVFRRYHKCTIGEYVRNLRIEFAQRQLAMSPAPLAEIAVAAGFCAQSHFSTAFKRQFGLTPAEYRAAIRSREKHDSWLDLSGR